jgi:multisubunit Na+/H+ antiporter MnhB subunit
MTSLVVFLEPDLRLQAMLVMVGVFVISILALDPYPSSQLTGFQLLCQLGVFHLVLLSTVLSAETRYDSAMELALSALLIAFAVLIVVVFSFL